MDYEEPSKNPILTRIFVSTMRTVTIPWLRSAFNTFLQDDHICRQIVGYIKVLHVTNIYDQNIFAVEILCGSDTMDDILESCQKSGIWKIDLNENDQVYLWEPDVWLGDNFKTYDEERIISREKLMQEWAKQRPSPEERIVVRLTQDEEDAYQERVALMKRVSKSRKYYRMPPKHFTKETMTFLKNMAERAIPSPAFFKKLADDQAAETAFIRAWTAVVGIIYL
jgi:hypothetical protein